MGTKDISEKLLEEYDDVFADIINVLLFDGVKVVEEGSLAPAATKSQYKADDGILHEQERDVSKKWIDRNVVLTLFGFENQTAFDKDMPLRVLNYDGASYRSQLLNGKERYPVVSIVLNFSDKKWERAKHLKEVIPIPPELEQYVNDYEITVFDICHLSDETLQKFTSDFGIVADYFVQKTRDHNYVPSTKAIDHVDEMMKFFSIFAKDERYTNAAKNIKPNSKGEVTMCEVLDKFIDQGIEKGIKQGIKQGMEKGMEEGIVEGEYQTLYNLYAKKLLTLDQAEAFATNKTGFRKWMKDHEYK